MTENLVSDIGIELTMAFVTCAARSSDSSPQSNFKISKNRHRRDINDRSQLTFTRTQISMVEAHTVLEI